MSLPIVAIVLQDKPSQSLEEVAIHSLVKNLGIKQKTASQIIENIPLKVYSNLSAHEGRVLVEALNLCTSLQWRVLPEIKIKFPSVNWNKRPTINGMSLEELILKNDPDLTGVGDIFPGLKMSSETSDPAIKSSAKSERSPEKKFSPKKTMSGRHKTVSLRGSKKEPSGSSERSHDHFNDSDSNGGSTILRTADSVITHLSADLEEAFRKKSMEGINPAETLPLYGLDSQNIPGNMKSSLAPGFYNLYLPPLKTRELRQAAETLCQQTLNWDHETFLESMAKPIVCIARNVDDVDALRLMERFQRIDIVLNCKLRSKI